MTIKCYGERQKMNLYVDFDSVPVIPPGLKVAQDIDQIASRMRGKVKFSDLNVSTYLDDGQKGGRRIIGYNLKKRLAGAGQKVLGAQLLDFYLEHSDLIPEELKYVAGWIYFWGTIYCDENDFYVRCLVQNGGGCISNHYKLSVGWDKLDPAAVWGPGS